MWYYKHSVIQNAPAPKQEQSNAFVCLPAAIWTNHTPIFKLLYVMILKVKKINIYFISLKKKLVEGMQTDPTDETKTALQVVCFFGLPDFFSFCMKSLDHPGITVYLPSSRRVNRVSRRFPCDGRGGRMESALSRPAVLRQPGLTFAGLPVPLMSAVSVPLLQGAEAHSRKRPCACEACKAFMYRN
jgi:hypothetical protein